MLFSKSGPFFLDFHQISQIGVAVKGDEEPMIRDGLYGAGLCNSRYDRDDYSGRGSLETWHWTNQKGQAEAVL